MRWMFPGSAFTFPHTQEVAVNWRRITALALVVATLGGAALALAATTPAPTAKPPATKTSSADKTKRIARGKYLVMVCGCNDCHTPGFFAGAPDMSRLVSGSEFGWQGPWGVTYARNLTPDLETGLGYWTEADIMKAIRSGVRPDGTPLLPPMPWQSFANLSDEDAASIADFLMSIPPVSHKVPDKLPPGQTPTGSVIVIPPPPAWDKPPEKAK